MYGILLVLLFAAGVLLAPLVAAHQGHVLIVLGTYRIEMTFVTLLMLLLLLMLVATGISVLLRKIWRFKEWLRHRRQAHASDCLWRALAREIEGDHQQAERLLISSAAHSEQPLLYYLLAAEAARQQRRWSQVKQYLAWVESRAGSDIGSQHFLPLKVSWIKLQLATQQLAEARTEIDTLLLAVPNHPGVRRLAQQLDEKTAASPITPCDP